MKKSSLLATLTLALVLLPTPITRAQGATTYLSNLGQASTGSATVASNSWVTVMFHTGTNTGGYALNSIQLALTDAEGSPSNFTVALAQGAAGAGPPPVPGGIVLGTLNGSLDPVTSGIYTYTWATSLTLAPNFYYCIVLTAGTSLADGTYMWACANTDSYSSSSGWFFEGAWTDATGKGAWIAINNTFPLFAVSATAVPEPSVVGLLALGSLCFLCRRREA